METNIQCSLMDNIILKNIFGIYLTILFNRVFIGNLESILKIKEIELYQLIDMNKLHKLIGKYK